MLRLHRKTIGEALWLLHYFYAESVRHGDPTTIAQYNHDIGAAANGVSVSTVKRWTRRLEQADLIQTTVLSNHATPTLLVRLTPRAIEALEASVPPQVISDPQPHAPQPKTSSPTCAHTTSDPQTTHVTADEQSVSDPHSTECEIVRTNFDPRPTPNTAQQSNFTPVEIAADHDHVFFKKEILKEKESHDRRRERQKNREGAGNTLAVIGPLAQEVVTVHTTNIPQTAPKTEAKPTMGDKKPAASNDSTTFARRHALIAALPAAAPLDDVLATWFEGRKIATTMRSSPHAAEVLRGCACRFRALCQWVGEGDAASKCGLVWCLVGGRNKWGRRYPIYPVLAEQLDVVACDCGATPPVAATPAAIAPFMVDRQVQPVRAMSDTTPDNATAIGVPATFFTTAKKQPVCPDVPTPPTPVALTSGAMMNREAHTDVRSHWQEWLPAAARAGVADVRQTATSVEIIARSSGMLAWLRKLDWSSFLTRAQAHANHTLALKVVIA